MKAHWVQGLPPSLMIVHSPALDTWSWAQTFLGNFSFFHLCLVLNFHEEKKKHIRSRSIWKPVLCWDEAAAHPLGCQVFEGRDLTFLASVSLGLVYHRGSASTIKTINCEHSMLENLSQKLVHFFIASIWSSAKAGKGHVPQENIIT